MQKDTSVFAVGDGPLLDSLVKILQEAMKTAQVGRLYAYEIIYIIRSFTRKRNLPWSFLRFQQTVLNWFASG